MTNTTPTSTKQTTALTPAMIRCRYS